MCIHGCVDGFSRAIIYLRVNNNKRAVTVLSCFQLATVEWGHPSRVRADNGGENVAVGDYMVWFRGENRGSFITGPSDRNIRIERLWRDVVESDVCIFSSDWSSSIHSPFLVWQRNKLKTKSKLGLQLVS